MKKIVAPICLLTCVLIFQNCQNEQSADSKIAETKPTSSPTSQPKSGSATAKIDSSASKTAQSPAEIEQQNEPTPPPSPIQKIEPTTSKNDQKLPKNFDDIEKLDASIRLDIKYATTDNFTKSKIYDCPKCLLRPEAAAAIVQAHRQLQKQNLGLKMFDCYRPRPYQQRLWDKVPNPDYVTPPARGSMHSRGAAVDLTIVDAAGKELDMGTPYDFFGREAHTDYLRHSPAVLKNRELLRSTLAAVGFKGIRTEWWHFSFQGKDFPLSDEVWECKK